ncbi:unnamed protein product [Durusdinium trenchii]|uniref:Non-specific serine/threonine protein kinase n=1 Tax=Durusdinium trenchii TaxID=1381693 RepID=A0ABP0P0Z0_9DINO
MTAISFPGVVKFVLRSTQRCLAPGLKHQSSDAFLHRTVAGPGALHTGALRTKRSPTTVHRPGPRCEGMAVALRRPIPALASRATLACRGHGCRRWNSSLDEVDSWHWSLTSEQEKDGIDRKRHEPRGVPCRRMMSGSSETTASHRLFPRTTYEGQAEEDVSSWLQKMNTCVGAFLRSTFVKGRPAEDLSRKYHIGEELGSGATATVFRAKNKRTGQEVALKAMCKDRIQDEQMLRNEISIHKATDHPNILRLLEIFEDEKNLFLVTELCGAGDLGRLLMASQDEFSANMVSEEEAFEILKQILNSIVYLHSRGIVHRDLKPGNFLCCAPDSKSQDESQNVAGKIRVIKLADFGVSSYCHVKHRLTRKCGTDGFMAPEIIRNQPYDQKADLFSVGCILHWLLTGHAPKAKEDGSYVMSKIRLNFVSAEARELVHQLTRPEPSERPSAVEVMQMPMLQTSMERLRKRSARMDAQLLDQMHAYGNFPLLKKAALVAMVSRAESDEDFAPSIERFMSLDRNMTSSIDVEDLYGALSEEMLEDMQSLVRKSLAVTTSRPEGSRGSRARQSQRRPSVASKSLSRHLRTSMMDRFQTDLKKDVERLVNKVDATGTGHISYSEWLAATADPEWYTDPFHINATFRLFDFDGDGMISEEDLKSVIPDVFKKLTVTAVLQESQLSAQQTSWISQECFSLLLRTQNASVFTLQRICDGNEDPVRGTA